MLLHRRLLGSSVLEHRRAAISVMPCANGGAASFRMERFYMSWTGPEVNPIVVRCD
jgi:hypothetical protein